MVNSQADLGYLLPELKNLWADPIIESAKLLMLWRLQLRGKGQ